MKEKIKKLWAKIKVHMPLIGVVALVGVFVLGLFFLSRWTEKEDKNLVSASAASASNTVSYYLPEQFSLIEPMTFNGVVESQDEYTVSFLNEERLSEPYTCISSRALIETSSLKQSITIRLSDYFILSSGFYSLNFFVPDSLYDPLRSVSFFIQDLEGEGCFGEVLVGTFTSSTYGIGNIYSIKFSYGSSDDPLDFVINLRNSQLLNIYDLQLYPNDTDYYTPYPSSRAYSATRLNERGYEAGYDVGFNRGYEDGESIGYNTGYGAGYAQGREVGIVESKEVVRDEVEQEVLMDKETFMDGIFTIFDAPLRLIRDIFNFEIFGINIADLVLFVLTAIIVVIVVKKLKGG